MHSQRRTLEKAPHVLVLATCLLVVGCASTRGPTLSSFVPQPGDLLFQDLDGSPFFDAIEIVTEGYRGANLTHVGMAAVDTNGNIVVLEALLDGVTVTPLDAFLNRSHDSNRRPKVLVGRLRAQYRHLIGPAVKEAWKLKGKPYDKVFDAENDTYYCSELVYRSFLEANGGKPLFQLEPMTFVDPDTGETFPAWKEYFAELDVPIPEGKPGLNPGGISRSSLLDIVYAYGVPNGWAINK
jgi:hypothetical protein